MVASAPFYDSLDGEIIGKKGLIVNKQKQDA
jgi:hypothetical protein